MNSLNPDTFSFLKELKTNNNRQWFNSNKNRYELIRESIKDFSNSIKNEMDEFDEIDKVKIFRIYRDVRFSKDKTPYKKNFGISFHRKKPELRGGYYIHIEENKTFIACGFWNPNKDDLFRIRKEFQIDSLEFRKIINTENFKKVWGALKGEELVTSPMGFSKDDPNIDLIRKKMYLFSIKYPNKEVLNTTFANKITTSFREISPFFDYMSNILTTDLNGESILK